MAPPVRMTMKRRVSAYTLQDVLAMAPLGFFVLTRNLWVDISCADWNRHGLAALFPNVVHFAAELAFLEHTPPTFHLVRLTLGGPDWRIFSGHAVVPPALCGITHLRVTVDSHDALPVRLATLSPTLRLQYIVLHSRTMGWNTANLCCALVPFFLSGVASVQRLLICGTQNVTVYSELAIYAKRHRERRLWVLDENAKRTQTIGDMFLPGDTFDAEQWTAGRPIYTDSD